MPSRESSETLVGRFEPWAWGHFKEYCSPPSMLASRDSRLGQIADCYCTAYFTGQGTTNPTSVADGLASFSPGSRTREGKGRPVGRPSASRPKAGPTEAALAVASLRGGV